MKPNPTRWIAALALLCIAIFSEPLRALALPTLVIQNGILTGANGVTVGSNLYNVQFLDGTCSALFNGCDQATDFTFQTQANAALASQALLDQVFLNSVLGNFDTAPNLTQGCSNNFVCNVDTPFQIISTTTHSTYNAVNSSSLTDQTVCCSTFTTALNSGTFPTVTYARWTPAASVPEPDTLTLFGLGAGALVLWDARWRHRRQEGK